jgi:hypothetical protein
MRRSTIGITLAALTFCAVAFGCWRVYKAYAPADVVILTLGEPYEDVRGRSRSTLPPLAANANWAGVLPSPASLRFTGFGDRQYSFVTPPAKYFAVTYDDRGIVDSVRLSPQVEVLPLDQSMAILSDLQSQLRYGGWRPFQKRDQREIDDTPEMRSTIRKCLAPTSRWKGGSEYQLALNIRCFRPIGREREETYLITLELSRPSIDDRSDDD